MFLFQSFPLGDKSSVNLRGNFHTENVTTFEDFLRDSGVEEEAATGDSTEVKTEIKVEEANVKPTETDKNSKEKASAMDIDTLYPLFWSLQHSFSNPPRLFEEENFKQFQEGLRATLAKFKETPLVLQSRESEREKGSKSQSGGNYEDFASTFNPKYLTSRDLFKLEVR